MVSVQSAMKLSDAQLEPCAELFPPMVEGIEICSGHLMTTAAEGIETHSLRHSLHICMHVHMSSQGTCRRPRDNDDSKCHAICEAAAASAACHGDLRTEPRFGTAV